MFINQSPVGVNQWDSLAPGVYRGMATAYVSSDPSISAVLAEFGPSSTQEISAAELIIKNKDEVLYYRNFLKQQDGMWRDSFGEKRDSLGELMPPEILGFRVFESIRISPFIVDQNK